MFQSLELSPLWLTKEFKPDLLNQARGMSGGFFETGCGSARPLLIPVLPNFNILQTQCYLFPPLYKPFYSTQKYNERLSIQRQSTLLIDFRKRRYSKNRSEICRPIATAYKGNEKDPFTPSKRHVRWF